MGSTIASPAAAANRLFSTRRPPQSQLSIGMKNVFEKTATEDLKARLDRLTAETRPQELGAAQFGV